MAAPCDWPIDTSCCPGWADFSPELRASATSWATLILWALTGRQYGPCPVTVRPCGRCVGQTYHTFGVWTDGIYNGSVSPNYIPYIGTDGAWRNACGCAGMCCCEPKSQVWLPGPITAVTQVRVNNVVIAPSQYRVDVATDGNWWLVAQNGQVWPECQNFDQPASGDNTFVVTTTRGTPVPAGGDAMVGALACEYAKLCSNMPCALSPAATSVTRDGVSYEILSAEDLIGKGLTPMANVNQWIAALNPHKLKQRPRVWSPDMDYPRQTMIA